MIAIRKINLKISKKRFTKLFKVSGHAIIENKKKIYNT